MKEGHEQEEVDDSGFYAGEISHRAVSRWPLSVPVTPNPNPTLLAAGGPVSRAGVTIAMDDQLLNGTNRVVLDGVMTEEECERILHLANVSWESETEGLLRSKRGRGVARRAHFPAHP